MKHIFIPSVISALCILSCAKSNDISADYNDKSSFAESVMDVTASIDNFVYADQSKTTFTPTPTGGSFSWTEGDKLGFWSNPQIGRAVQVVFDVTSAGDDINNATFHGNCYGILRGNTYYTYYPYDSNAESTAVTIKYDGQNPSGDDGLANLGKFDYLYSDEYEVPASGDISFQYHHKGCIAKFIFTLPSSNVGNITKFNLSSKPNTLIDEAKYNPLENPSQTTVISYKDSLSYNLGTKTGGSYAGLSPTGNQLVVYTMMCPTNLDGKTFTATLYDNAGNVYKGTSSTLSGTQETTTIYPYEITVEDVTGVKDLSAIECANCYIVSAPGQYKFKTRRYGESSNIANIASAEIYWETNNTSTAPESNTIISGVSYSNGYITFSKPSSTEGNALIIAKNSSKTILWSWHIWCTDAPKDEEYPNNAGKLMDRNLGALGTKGFDSHGLLYQWGRKDPFMGHLVLNKAGLETYEVMTPNKHTELKDEYPDATTYTGSNSQEYSIQNPGPVLLSSSGEWQTSPIKTDRWRTSDGGKTIHDPCPPGYKVMNGTQTSATSDRTGFYSKAYDISGTQYSTAALFTNRLVVYDSDGKYLNMKLNDGQYAYYPADGYLSNAGGRNGQDVSIWANYPGGLYFSSTWQWGTQLSNVLNGSLTYGNFTPNWGSNRADSRSVRCQKM